MRRHPVIGAQIVAPLEFFAEGALIVRHHHERARRQRLSRRAARRDDSAGRAHRRGRRRLRRAHLGPAVSAAPLGARRGARAPRDRGGPHARRAAARALRRAWSPMRLLSAPFETERAARLRRASRGGLRLRSLARRGAGALARAAGRALGWARAASVRSATPLASGAVHGGLPRAGLGAGDSTGAPGWRGPALRGRRALALASLAAPALSAGRARRISLVPGCARCARRRRQPRLERPSAGARPRARAPCVGRGGGSLPRASICSSPRRSPRLPGCVPDGRPLPGGARLRRRRQRAHGGVALPGRDLLGALAALELLAGRAGVDRRWRSLRYLLDPALPHAVELMAGAVFYLALLGLGCLRAARLERQPPARLPRHASPSSPPTGCSLV